MLNNHRSALEAKHASIEQRITDEAHRPMPDNATISALKKQKLKIKEEMTLL